jgi:hypothetical protein
MLKHGFFAVGIFLLVCCSIGSVSAEKWGDVTDEEWNMQPPKNYPEANAEVIYDVGEMKVTLDAIDFTRHVRIKVFTDKGAEDVGDIAIQYYKDDKLKGLKAQTITPDGKKHEVKGGDIHSREFGSQREKTFAFPAVVPGSILEYKYENVNQRFRALDPWYFQTDLFTLKSSFTLVLAPGFTYSSLVKNIPSFEKDPKVEDAMSTQDKLFTWTRTDLPPVTDEPYMSAVRDYLSSLYCQLVSYESPYFKQTFITGWADLGDFFSKFVDDYAHKDNGVKEAVAAIIDPNASKSESNARAIYRYVTQEIKTKSTGDWWTHDNLKEMLVDKFGTSDEKNVLLTKMLREAGIDAWPVMISTRSHGTFKPELYQLTQLNKVITYAVVDSTGIYMDASSRFCPYGSLPANSMSNAGLLLDGENSELVRIFAVLPKCYRIDATNIEIDSAGEAHCQTTVGLTGYFTSTYGSRYESEEPEDFVKKRFVDRISKDYQLGEYSFDFDTTSNQCKLNVAYTTNDLTESLDQNLLVTPAVYYLKTNPFTLKQRDFPVDFGFPFTYQNIVNIKCDGGYTPGQLPNDTTLQIDGATFERHTMVNGGDVTVESKLVVETANFLPSQYFGLRQFFTGIEDADNQKVVFTKAAQ